MLFGNIKRQTVWVQEMSGRGRSRSPRRRSERKSRSSSQASGDVKGRSQRDKRSPPRSHGKARSRSRSKSRGSRSRSRSRGRGRSSSGTSEASSRSRSRSRHRRKHKHRKHSKHRKHHRRHRRSRSSSSSSSSGSSQNSAPQHAGVIDQKKFGSRGIINSSHMLSKRDEFQEWLQDLKGIPADAPVPKGELAALFSDFAEDHNCCSFPHEKYYDLATWEAKVAAGKASKTLTGSVATAASAGAMDMLAESQARQRAARDEARKAEGARMAAYLANMDPARRAEIAERQALESRLQFAFKSGATGEVEKIKRHLEEIDKRAAQQRK